MLEESTPLANLLSARLLALAYLYFACKQALTHVFPSCKKTEKVRIQENAHTHKAGDQSTSQSRLLWMIKTQHEYEIRSEQNTRDISKDAILELRKEVEFVRR